MYFSCMWAKHKYTQNALLPICGLLLSACATNNINKAIPEVVTLAPQTAVAQSADEIVADLSPAAAITALDDAANNAPEKSFEFLVRALEITIEHGTTEAAEERLASLRQRYRQQPDKSVQLAILYNHIVLKRDQPGEVIKNLNDLLPQATLREKLSIQSLKAQALLHAGFPIDSVQLRITLDKDYQQHAPQMQAVNDALLWDSLMQVQPELISGHISEIPDTFSKWLELAYVYRHPPAGATLNAAIDGWVARNPHHPANRLIVERIKRKHIATSQHPDHIALLLPLSGKLAPVGKAVRDGFMATYLETKRTLGINIKIDIYDTQGDAEKARQAVELANTRRTQFIVGPLDRKTVAAAIDANQPPLTDTTTATPDARPPTLDAATATPGATTAAPDAVTVAPYTDPYPPATEVKYADMLTLNTTTDNTSADAAMLDASIEVKTTPDVYQFDLSPESEARQVAEQVGREALERAVVIAPQNVWGDRIYEAFAARYRELGGEIIDVYRFNKGTADHSGNIQRVLQLHLSNNRHKQIAALIDEDVGFIPRRRQDVDMIFIAAAPHEARLIKPQLKFFYAGDIPVYATSSIYSGHATLEQNKDMEDIRFCDMPWMLSIKPAPGSLQKTIITAWPQSASKYLRFYALGVDAFLLLPQLQWLQENRNDWLTGATGKLSLNKAGVVQRQLSWAQFKNAAPVTYDQP